MIDLAQLKEIDEYLSQHEFANKSIQVMKVKQLITDLINGNDISSQLRELFPDDEGKMNLTDQRLSDAELLLNVLQNCDEDILMMLEQKFGENSRVTKIIREKVRNIPSKTSHDLQITIDIKTMMDESKRSGNQLYKLICERMAEKGYMTDSDFYNRISMSRQNFSRVRNADRRKGIGKYCLLWIIVGLRLNYSQAVEMLNVAGFHFKKDDKSDIVISYIIKNVRDYDLDVVNDYLYHFGLKTFCE